MSVIGLLRSVLFSTSRKFDVEGPLMYRNTRNLYFLMLYLKKIQWSTNSPRVRVRVFTYIIFLVGGSPLADIS